MSWRPTDLAAHLAALEQQYMRGDIDIATWERLRLDAIADDNTERRRADHEARE